MASHLTKGRRKNVRRPQKVKGNEKIIPWAPGFRLPKERDIHRATGLDRSSEKLKHFEPVNHFDKLTCPLSDKDWLANNNEEGQSYLQFLGHSPWLQNKKVKDFKNEFYPSGNNILEKYPSGKIYLINMHMEDNKSSTIDSDPVIEMLSLKEYLHIYYGIPVGILPNTNIKYIEDSDTLVINSVTHKSETAKSVIEPTFRRHSKSGSIQMRIDTGLLDVKSLIPDDGIFLIAVTMVDLYGDKTDLFTIGTGSAQHRLGIFSFKRYDPYFIQNSEENWFDHSNNNSKSMDTIERNKTILQRSCKTLVHEVGHLLGIKHCIYYSCCMNGSGHLEEDLRQPIHLCPVDLHKIATLSGIDIKERYSNLAKFYKAHDMNSDHCWIVNRLKYITE